MRYYDHHDNDEKVVIQKKKIVSFNDIGLIIDRETNEDSVVAHYESSTEIQDSPAKTKTSPLKRAGGAYYKDSYEQISDSSSEENEEVEKLSFSKHPLISLIMPIMRFLTRFEKKSEVINEEISEIEATPQESKNKGVGIVPLSFTKLQKSKSCLADLNKM